MNPNPKRVTLGERLTQKQNRGVAISKLCGESCAKTDPPVRLY